MKEFFLTPIFEQNGSSYLDKMAPEDMTSKEYYLDSTAHFAVHEVCQERKKTKLLKKHNFYLGIIKR